MIAAGCGGSSSAQEEPDASTLEALWRAPGEDVAIVPGSADFGPGEDNDPAKGENRWVKEWKLPSEP